MQTSHEMALEVMKILDSKKGKDILLIDIAKMTIIADYFVLCSATSTIQSRALADEVEEKMSEKGNDVIRKEGFGGSRWIVLDYGNVMVHIFHEQERAYYNLERLWVDGNNAEGFGTSS
jgi:ribosome-associated protein